VFSEFKEKFCEKRQSIVDWQNLWLNL
jgi:hypothetical protein